MPGGASVGGCAMAVDPRQIVSGFLTLTMLLMLGNMIKHDHFDFVQRPMITATHINAIKVEEDNAEIVQEGDEGPWKENIQELKSCWQKPILNTNDKNETKGYISFSLTSGPEYHLSQVAVAVVVARYLGATLVLPDIRGRELGNRRKFEDVYDVQKFVGSLEDAVKVIPELPGDLTDTVPAMVRIPNRITEDYIMKNIQPIFEKTNHVRLAIYFPSTNMKIKAKDKNEMKSIGCLAMFGVLDLKPELKDAVDLVVDRLRTLSRKSDGRFVSVDLRIYILEKKGCHESGKRTCYEPREVGDFLKRMGFDGDTTIYVTQSSWHDSLNVIKEKFPKTYTKDDIFPAEKKELLQSFGNIELEKVFDFYVCSESNVFVPAISGMFYGNVVGRRIAAGRTQILVPNTTVEAASPSKFISSYVSKKNHIAYLCYC